MTAAVMERPSWSRRRWWWMVALVFGSQITLVCWLGDRGLGSPHQHRPPQTLRMLESVPAEWLALTDPTLFALPHRQSFAPSAWLALPALENHPYEWTEDPSWLPLPPTGVGAIGLPVEAAAVGQVRIPPLPDPDLPVSAAFLPSSLGGPSQLRIRGPLADRRLLTPFQHPDPTNTDILSPTVVQVEVDGQGRPSSFTLLTSSSLPAADQSALEFTRLARFDPLPEASGTPDLGPELTWGTLVFEWHTLPATNALNP